MFYGTGVGDIYIYWLLRIILLCALIYSGWGIATFGEKRFNHFASIAIFFYSLIQGLRWLRGTDYAHYYNDIVTNLGDNPISTGFGQTVTSDPEPLYKLFINIFYYTGLPFWVAFILYSFILIHAVTLILKHYHKAAIWVLPMFYMATRNSSENLVRQYIASALLLYAYYYYLECNKKKMFVFLASVLLVHYSGIIAVSVFLLIIYLPKKIFKIIEFRNTPYLLLGLYCFCFFFWDMSFFDSVATFVQKYASFAGSKGAGYAENAERWFTSAGSIAEVLGTDEVYISTSLKTIRFLAYSSLIYWGYNLQSKDVKLKIGYYFSYLMIFFETVGSDIEMYQRFQSWFLILFPIFAGIFISQLKMTKWIRYAIYGTYSIYFLWYNFFISFMAQSPLGFGFVWDK